MKLMALTRMANTDKPIVTLRFERKSMLAFLNNSILPIPMLSCAILGFRQSSSSKIARDTLHSGEDVGDQTDYQGHGETSYGARSKHEQKGACEERGDVGIEDGSPCTVEA